MSKKLEKIRLSLRQLNGEADPEEKNAFSNWLLAKSENLDTYIEVKNLWETPMTRELKFNSTEAEKRILKAVNIKKGRTLCRRYTYRIASIVLILISIGTFAYYQLAESQPKIVETKMIRQISKTSGAGEQLRVTLPDGSIVRLNAGSSIHFPEKFTENFRLVNLVGEAFFEVTKDPQHPFIVTSGSLTTIVWGTSFNIKAFEKTDIAVTVATGKVKVVSQSGNKSSEIFLNPNEQAIYNQNKNQLRINEVDAKNYYSWTDGILRFNDDSFNEVVEMIERWYNVSIRIEGQSNNKIRVNGSYKDKKLYTILDGLSFMYDLSYQYQNDTTIIIYNKKINP
jgi:ferric-dicitrate binding protein FerR (iron transport regulator)